MPWRFLYNAFTILDFALHFQIVPSNNSSFQLFVELLRRGNFISMFTTELRMLSVLSHGPMWKMI